MNSRRTSSARSTSPTTLRHRRGLGHGVVPGLARPGTRPRRPAGLAGRSTPACGRTTSPSALPPAAEEASTCAAVLTFLGRGPVPAEVDGWVTRFLQGASNEDVVAGFVGSREHFYNPAKGKGTRAAGALLRRAARAPSEGEVHTWVAALSRV